MANTALPEQNYDQTEVEIMETIDYGENDYRYEIEGDSRSYDYERESFGSMGYQRQEFDEDSGQLVSSDAEEADSFEESDEVFEEAYDEQ